MRTSRAGHRGRDRQRGRLGDGADDRPDERALALLVEPGVEVIGDPQGLEAGLLGELGLPDQFFRRVLFTRQEVSEFSHMSPGSLGASSKPGPRPPPPPSIMSRHSARRTSATGRRPASSDRKGGEERDRHEGPRDDGGQPRVRDRAPARRAAGRPCRGVDRQAEGDAEVAGPAAGSSCAADSPAVTWPGVAPRARASAVGRRESTDVAHAMRTALTAARTSSATMSDEHDPVHLLGHRVGAPGTNHAGRPGVLPGDVAVHRDRRDDHRGGDRQAVRASIGRRGRRTARRTPSRSGTGKRADSAIRQGERRGARAGRTARVRCWYGRRGSPGPGSPHRSRRGPRRP